MLAQLCLLALGLGVCHSNKKFAMWLLTCAVHSGRQLAVEAVVTTRYYDGMAKDVVATWALQLLVSAGCRRVDITHWR